jgi:excinuclease ABC subunit A
LWTAGIRCRDRAQLEVIKCADWIIDLGPEAGDAGGEIVATGMPEQIAATRNSHTGRFLRRLLSKFPKPLRVIPSREGGEGPHEILHELERSFEYAQDDRIELARAAETAPRFGAANRNGAIYVHGAREHNLKNIDLKIPREQLVVITGLSGSGKSTVAFDIYSPRDNAGSSIACRLMRGNSWSNSKNQMLIW